jgi:exonuclease SbcD
MKFIHTADWHLGQNFFQHSRDEEFRHFFNNLLNTIRSERPDALLVAGDIFDNALPGVEAQQFYYDTVVTLHEACPDMHIFIIAGNHDSASRLEAPNRLWSALNVTVVGSLAKSDGEPDYTRHIFAVQRQGTTVGYVVAVPHTYSGNLPHTDEGDDSYSARARQLFTRLHSRAAAVNPDVPIVLMAHLAAVANTDSSAWSQGVGGKDSFDITPVASLYDYIALGHIHNPAPLSSLPNVRYAGAPIPISFDETYLHGVIIGEVTRGSVQLLREEYDTLMPVLRIPAKPAAPDVVVKALRDFPADRRAYLQANVLQEGSPAPDLKERIRRALEGKQARFCDIKYTYPERSEQAQAITVRDLSELRAIDPLDLAKAYYKEKTDTDMSVEQIELFNRIVEEVKTAKP